MWEVPEVAISILIHSYFYSIKYVIVRKNLKAFGLMILFHVFPENQNEEFSPTILSINSPESFN